MIQARMRIGATWSDACILNLSSRGMLVHAQSVPERGNYLEIRRGQHVVVARVVWSGDQRCGVRTQDPLRADQLIAETDNSSFGSRSMTETVERRSAPRPTAARYEASRTRGRAFEFGSLAAVGLAAAFLLFATLDELLGRPLVAVEAVLASGTAGRL